MRIYPQRHPDEGRWNDSQEERFRMQSEARDAGVGLVASLLVAPAKAGVQKSVLPVSSLCWIPAFAGMTKAGGRSSHGERPERSEESCSANKMNGPPQADKLFDRKQDIRAALLPARPFAICSGLSLQKPANLAIGTGGSPTTTGCCQPWPLRQSIIRVKFQMVQQTPWTCFANNGCLSGIVVHNLSAINNILH